MGNHAVKVVCVVAYARVSTGEQGISLDDQQSKLRLYCQLHSLETAAVIAEAESAKGLDRPGIRQALALLDSGAAGGLVVYKLDRLTRSLGDWTYLIKHYFGGKGKATLMSVSESIDTRTAGGRLFLNLMMTVAEWEREAISERTLAALAYKRSRGERVGKVPFGWDLEPDGVHLSLNHPEQLALVAIAQWAAAAWTTRRIAAELDRLGIRPKSGGAAWAHTSVAAILRRQQAAAT
jgi:site-specific DNA recombinase